MPTKSPEKSQQLHDVISMIAPERASSLARKYRKVMSSITAAELIGSTFDKSELNRITDSLLEIQTSPQDQTEIDRRKQLVLDLQDELNIISTQLDTMGPGLLDHDPKLHEKNKYTNLDKSIVAAFDQAVRILKAEYGTALNMSAITAYLRKPAGPNVPQHEVGLFKLQTVNGKNMSALWQWADYISNFGSNGIKLTAIQNLVEKYLLAYVFQNKSRFFKGKVSVKPKLLKKWPLMASILKTPLRGKEEFSFTEVTRITQSFRNIEDTLEKHGLFSNLDTYMRSYNGIVPIDDLETQICNIFSKVNNARKRDYILQNLDHVYTALGLLCNGFQKRGTDQVNRIMDDLLFLDTCKDFRKETGLNKITDRDINGLVSAIVRNGIEKDKNKAVKFVIAYIKKLKKLDPVHFTAMAENMSSAQLSEFLLVSIIISPKKLPQSMKFSLMIEANYICDVKKHEKILAALTKKLRERIKKLQEARKRPKLAAMKKRLKYFRKRLRDASSWQETDKYKRLVKEQEENIADYEGPLARSVLAQKAAVSDLMTKMANSRKKILRAKARKDLAALYLSKKGVSPRSKRTLGVIKKIQALETYKDLSLYAEKLKISQPPSLDLMQVIELNRSMLVVDAETDALLNKKEQDEARLALNLYLRTGKITDKNKKLVEILYEGKIGAYKRILSDQQPAEMDMQNYYKSIRSRYTTLSEVPADKKKEVAMKLTAYMGLLSGLQKTSGKLIGMYYTMQMLGNDVKDDLEFYKGEGQTFEQNLREVVHFIGGKDDKIPKLDEMTVSPYQAPLLSRELTSYDKKLDIIGGKISTASRDVLTANKRFKGYKKRPEYFRNRLVGIDENFEFGIGALGNLVTAMEAARKNIIEEVIPSLKKLLEHDGSASRLSPAMKKQRKAIIKAYIARLEASLRDPNSPTSKEAIARILKSKKDLKGKWEKFKDKRTWAFVLIASIIIASVALAVVGGWAGAALGRLVFGTVVAGTVTEVGLITVGAGVSSFATAVTAAYGVGIGAALGARFARQVFSWTGAIETPGGWKKIWDPEDFLYDAAVGTCIGLATIGVSHALVRTLARVARSTKYLWMARAARSGLKVVKGLEKLVNPTKWFRPGIKPTQSTLKAFGVQFTEELGEEAGESIAEVLGGPVAGLIAGVINAADGVNVDLSMHTLAAKDIGITLEGNTFTYTTKTPEEFVANLETHLDAKKSVDYDVKINEDGSVTLSLLYAHVDSRGNPIIDPRTGLQKVSSPVMVDIKPAQLSQNLTLDVELSRMQGLQEDPATGELSVVDGDGYLQTLADLHTRGFTYELSEKGLIVSKAGVKFEINVDPKIKQGLSQFMESIAELDAIDKQRDSKGRLSAALKKRRAVIYMTMVAAFSSTGCGFIKQTVLDIGTLLSWGIPTFLILTTWTAGGGKAAKDFWGQSVNQSQDERFETIAKSLIPYEEVHAKVLESSQALGAHIGTLKAELSSWAKGKSRAEAATIISRLEIDVNAMVSKAQQLQQIIQDAADEGRPYTDAENARGRALNKGLSQDAANINAKIAELRRLPDVDVTKMTRWIWPIVLIITFFNFRDDIYKILRIKQPDVSAKGPEKRKPMPGIKVRGKDGRTRTIRGPKRGGMKRTMRPLGRTPMRGRGTVGPRRAPWSGMRGRVAPPSRPMGMAPKRIPPMIAPAAMKPIGPAPEKI